MPRTLKPDSRISLLSDRLAKYLRSEAESGAQLAHRVGVHPSQISRLLRRRTKTVSRSVRKICEGIGVSIPHQTPSIPEETRAALDEAVRKITDDDAERAGKLANLLQLIASLWETG
jgi:transcriptional regulator with XRE-family HTH domain